MSETNLNSKFSSFSFYKLIEILRRQYHIILTANWERIYSVLSGVAKLQFFLPVRK